MFKNTSSIAACTGGMQLCSKFNPHTGYSLSRHHASISAHLWTAVRRTVFERDGYRCVMCGRAGRLECDHVTPLQREPGQDPFDPNGLQTLCRRCHIDKTRGENRREPTPAEAAWRKLVNELLE